MSIVLWLLNVFDMNFNESSALLVFIDIVFYVIIFICLKRTLKYPYSVTKNQRTVAMVFILLFCLLSFWGSDWFHYFEIFPELKSGYNTHVEKVYLTIGAISPNYIIFRFFIWGSGLALLGKTFSKLEVSKDLCWFIFATSYLIWYSYARASLAMAIAFCGFALVVGKDKRRYSVLLGFVLILCSFFFHKSSAFAIGCIVLTLIAQRYPKLTYALLILLFPILVIYINSSLSEFMMMSFDADSGDMNAYMESGQRYFDGSQGGGAGMGEKLRNMFERVPYYCTTALSLFAIFRNRINPPSSIKPFMVLQVIIVLMSSAFLFTSADFTTGTIYARFLRFAFIPTAIVLAYLYQCGYAHKYVRYSVYIAITGAVYAITYSFYCRIVG